LEVYKPVSALDYAELIILREWGSDRIILKREWEIGNRIFGLKTNVCSLLSIRKLNSSFPLNRLDISLL